MNSTPTDAWAWAILDRVIIPDKTGFTERHTVAIAETRDPRPDGFLHQPAFARPLAGGDIDYFQPLQTWGWATVGDFERIDTRVRKPTKTNTSFGAIKPYRAVARVRRGPGHGKDEVEPVPYGGELAGIFSRDHYPTFLGGDSDHPLLGSVYSAFRLLAEATEAGIRHCTEPAPARPGVDDDHDCVHIAEAREMVTVSLSGQLMQHAE